MSFWLKDYSILLNKLEYLQFKLTDKELSSTERTAAEGELQYCFDRKEKFEKLVSKFDSIEQKILYEKYVNGKTLIQVAEELGYSEHYIYDKHSQIKRLIKFSEGRGDGL
ncbi:hypothetical protein [Lysinibacillus xylanilyticus]|uniref:hypothetical protein n=1 Tax=Lysinibacillus xylanilyticus TaxID=582475 RepID=UPI003D04D71E